MKLATLPISMIIYIYIYDLLIDMVLLFIQVTTIPIITVVGKDIVL